MHIDLFSDLKVVEDISYVCIVSPWVPQLREIACTNAMRRERSTVRVDCIYMQRSCVSCILQRVRIFDFALHLRFPSTRRVSGPNDFANEVMVYRQRIELIYFLFIIQQNA